MTGRRLDWLVALTAASMVGGAWIDLWSHHTTEVESFLTPSHGVLYAGFLATALVLLAASVRRRDGRFGIDPPAGYRVALLGVPLFLVGGIGDSVWHTVFGIEQDLDALLSPTHLLLGLGSALMASGPFAAAWQRARLDEVPGREPRQIDLPALVSLGLVASVAVFFASFANPFSLPLAAGEAIGTLGNLGIEGEAEAATTSSLLEQALGVASILVTVAVLLPAILAPALRWRVPFGGIALVFALSAGVSALPHEIVAFLPAILAAGLAADALAGLLRPSLERPLSLAGFAVLVPAILAAAYIVVVQVTVGLAWPVALWSGSIVLAGAVGGGLALLTIAAFGVRRSAADASRPAAGPT